MSPRRRRARARRRSSSASASSRAASSAWSASACSQRTSAPACTPTCSARACGCRTCCRTCSAKARSPRRSFRRTRRCSARAARAEAGRVAGAAFALLLADRRRDLAARRAARAVASSACSRRASTGQRRELLIAVVRILFPMTGVLVLSAWALGILNSHRRFFLPYFAPVLWNARDHRRRSSRSARGSISMRSSSRPLGARSSAARCSSPCSCRPCCGSTGEIRLSTGRDLPAFKEAVRKAGPAIMGRGVVQLSGYLDLVLASLLADRRRRAAALRADAVSAADQPVRHEHRGGRVARSRARPRWRHRRAARAHRRGRAPRCVLRRAELRRVRRASATCWSRASIAPANSARPTHALVWLVLIGYSLGLAGVDDDARLSIGVLRAARYGDAGARRVRARARRARGRCGAHGAVRARHGARRTRFRPVRSLGSTWTACRSARSGSLRARRSVRGSSGRC